MYTTAEIESNYLVCYGERKSFSDCLWFPADALSVQIVPSILHNVPLGVPGQVFPGLPHIF